MTREEKAQEFARSCAEYNNLPIEVEHLLHTAFIVGYNEREGEEKNPWHKASEELPKMAHFTTDGDYSDLCVCINEAGEHKILVLCESGEDTYWAYGYDGEGLYDEEMDGGEIVKWMELPKED